MDKIFSLIFSNSYRNRYFRATGKLDSNNNLYIVSADAQTTREVLDQGGLVSFNYYSANYSYSETVYAIEAIDINTSDSNSIDAYKVLIKGSDTYDSVTTDYYTTVNVTIDNPSSLSTSTLSVDWSSFAYYDQPKQLEKVFNTDLDGDGSIYDPSTQAKTKITTDTKGAELQQTSDGSLYIKDGNSTIQIKTPDGGFVSLAVNDTWTGGSFTAQPYAVQAVDSN